MSKKGPKKMYPSLEDSESSRRVHWGRDDLLNLVDKVGEHWQEFNNGVRKKKFIWKDIAAEISQHDFVVGGDECDRKWRNLKIRYLAVLEKQMSGEKSAHRIDYFDKIHAFLKNDSVTLSYLEQRSIQQKCKLLVDQKAENEEELPDIDDVYPSLEDSESSRRVHWGHSDVLNLVDKVGEHWQEFNNGVRKKKFIWKDIAAEISQHDFVVGGDECDRKWRNLKIRYLAVLEKQMSGEKSAHRIDYFDKIHAFLKNDSVTLSYLEQRSIQQKCKLLVDQKAENEEELPDIDDGLLDWSNRAVQLLLDLLLEFKDWFIDQDNDWDDSTIWETISEQMKLEGHQPSSEQCCRKWASLTMEFQHHKAEAETTGSVSLWPYYTRVRHVLAQVGTPIINKTNTPVTLESGSKTHIKRGIKRTRGDAKTRILPICKQEVEDMEYATEEQTEAVTASTEHELPKEKEVSGRITTASTEKDTLQPGDIREICQRLENIEENMAICGRLDHLEAQLDTAAEQRRAQQQTNALLGQVLTELSALRRTLSTRHVHKVHGQDTTDLSSGITIVVPQSQQLQ